MLQRLSEVLVDQIVAKIRLPLLTCLTRDYRAPVKTLVDDSGFLLRNFPSSSIADNGRPKIPLKSSFTVSVELSGLSF